MFPRSFLCTFFVCANVFAADVPGQIQGDPDAFFSVFAEAKLERLIREEDPRFFWTEVRSIFNWVWLVRLG